MFVMSFLSNVFPRVFRFRAHGLLALIIIAVGFGICALIGFWAGKVAQGKGREFGVFFAPGFLLAICGVIPGLIVVIIAYAISPAPVPGVPVSGYQTQAPPSQPPQPPQPRVPPTQPATPATPSPQGGYEYVPPPAAPPPPPGPQSGGPVPPPPPPQ